MGRLEERVEILIFTSLGHTEDIRHLREWRAEMIATARTVLHTTSVRLAVAGLGITAGNVFLSVYLARH